MCRYSCGERVLRVKSAVKESDSGRYCCILDLDDGEKSLCIDIEVDPKSKPSTV